MGLNYGHNHHSKMRLGPLNPLLRLELKRTIKVESFAIKDKALKVASLEQDATVKERECRILNFGRT